MWAPVLAASEALGRAPALESETAGVGTGGVEASFASMSAPEQERILRKCRLVLAQPAAVDQNQLAVCRALALLAQ